MPRLISSGSPAPVPGGKPTRAARICTLSRGDWAAAVGQQAAGNKTPAASSSRPRTAGGTVAVRSGVIRRSCAYQFPDPGLLGLSPEGAADVSQGVGPWNTSGLHLIGAMAPG